MIVEGAGAAFWNGRELRCAIGQKGFSTIAARTDGDMTTPVGRWPIREVFYRADKIAKPDTCFPLRAIAPDDGWGDCPDDAVHYNKYLKHPQPFSAEKLWREDDVYDLIAVLGFNDAPPMPGKGSAIFLHVARDDFSGTAGCVALSKDDLLLVLREATLDTAVLVRPLA